MYGKKKDIDLVPIDIESKNDLSIIIITIDERKRKENLRKLIVSLKEQTFLPNEIIIVHNYHPAGLARNTGSKYSKYSNLLFIDDDAILGDDKVIEQILICFEELNYNGLLGASTQKIKNSNIFQNIYYNEFERSYFVPKSKFVESDMATTLFCIIRKNIFLKIGKFDERICASEDPEFRDRLRYSGYKTYVCSGAKVIHPPPRNILELWKRGQWYGKGNLEAYLLFKNDKWRSQHYRIDPLMVLNRFLFWWMLFFFDFKESKFRMNIIKPIDTLSWTSSYLLNYVKHLLPMINSS